MSSQYKLKYYTSEKGVYVNLGHLYRYLDGVNINNKQPETTLLDSWVYVEGEEEVLSLQKLGSAQYINPRWELIDEDLKKLGAKDVLTQEEAGEWYDDDDGYCVSSEVKYGKYYKRVYDKIEPVMEDQLFEATLLGHIEESLLEGTSTPVYTLKETDLYHPSEKKVDLSQVVEYGEIAKMLCCPLTIHNQPCSINRKTSYNIIRNYIKENIDGKYAQVSSDYDFCFSVLKVISIKPYTETTQITKSNGRSYAKPKFNKRTIEAKTTKVFETSPEGYSKYPLAPSFKGDNLQDLAENVKLYLDELMDIINQPVKECSSCNGTGHIIQGGNQ